MQNGERVFYSSENGDRWLLMSGQEDIVSVRQVPNAASGGEPSTYELGAYLMTERHSAQNQALRALISSLTRKGGVAAPPIGDTDGDADEVIDNADKLDRD